MATQILGTPESPETPTILTLTQQHREGQALQQYAYDPAIIDQAVMLGDMAKMVPEMRLAFYKAVCLSVGLNPLTQPFTVLKRQDGTTWLYANSTCTQQLAALYRISFRDVVREQVMMFGEPLYLVRLTASTPDGRSMPSQAAVSLTKKKREVAGKWPNGDPKFRDVLDADGEPVLITLRGEALANAIMRSDTKAFRRATLALVGLGWMQSDFDGRAVTLDLRTGALGEDQRLVPATRYLDTPEEQAKTTQEHIADLMGDQAVHPTSDSPAVWLARIEGAIVSRPGSKVEEWMIWAERRFKKGRTEFTPTEYETFLTAVQRAPVHTTEKASQMAQETSQAPEATRGLETTEEAPGWHGEALAGDQRQDLFLAEEEAAAMEGHRDASTP